MVRITNRNIKEVMVCTLLVSYLFVQAISNGCSSGLVDDAQHIKSSDDSSVFGGLTLGVIEVSRNCYNCTVDRLGRQ